VSQPARRRAVVAAVLALLCVPVVVVAVRVVQVHDQGWEWRLSPTAAPPKLSWHHRDYRRAAARAARPAGAVEIGRTPGGGRVLEEGAGPGTPTALFVDTGHEVFAYGLMGGP